MTFLEKIKNSYTILLASDLSSQIMKLADDIINLDYDGKTEKDLLSSLEKIYDFTKGKGTTADIDWQQNIRENKEKKERIKEKLVEKNKRAKQYYQKQPTETPFETKLKDKFAQEKKKQIADNIKKLDNLISVDFKAAKQQPKTEVNIDLPKRANESLEEYKIREQRIKTSLEKINDLMSSLKEKANKSE